MFTTYPTTAAGIAAAAITLNDSFLDRKITRVEWVAQLQRIDTALDYAGLTWDDLAPFGVQS